MAEAADTNGQIMQNLRDAGCDESMIEIFMALCAQCRTKEQRRLLSAHRKELLDTVHDNQKRIDCLDYLIHKLKL